MTLDSLPSSAIDLVPDLIRFTPPARVIDKRCYSPWVDPSLRNYLENGHIDTLIISGGETDVCVLATVLGAIDLGYRVIIPRDALCSTCDETHEKTIDLYTKRFSMQVEISSVKEVLDMLPSAKTFL